MRILVSLTLALSLAGCAFDEGINIHDLSGTVLVPKSAAPTAESVGMIYVGLYSEIDDHLGFPSPVAAPAASSAGADTFPYGGTSIGTFYSRDLRTTCSGISGRTVRDEGANWALDFDVLRFPFYEGTNVWAWMDTYVEDTAGNVANGYTSCDTANGYYSYFQIEVEQTDVVQEGVEWRVNLVDSDLEAPAPEGPVTAHGNASTNRYQDADGKLWQVVDIDVVNDAFNVVDIYSWGGKPSGSGRSVPIFIDIDDDEDNDGNDSPGDTVDPRNYYFGSQFQDVLNFPGKYVRGIDGATPGDYVSQTPVVLDNLSDKVELTIDLEVP